MNGKTIFHISCDISKYFEQFCCVQPNIYLDIDFRQSSVEECKVLKKKMILKNLNQDFLWHQLFSANNVRDFAGEMNAYLVEIESE